MMIQGEICDPEFKDMYAGITVASDEKQVC